MTIRKKSIYSTNDDGLCNLSEYSNWKTGIINSIYCTDIFFTIFSMNADNEMFSQLKQIFFLLNANIIFGADKQKT